MDDLGVDPKNAKNVRNNLDTNPNYNQKKRRSRSTSPNQIEKTKKLKGDNVGESHTDFTINTKPDYDNLMMESCYNIPTYRCVFLDHKIKDKNSDLKEWRYFSKKNRAAVMHVSKGSDNAVDASINNDKVIDHNGDSVEIKTKKFNEDLIKDPANVDLWISFVKFQEEKLKSDMKINEFKNSADKRILNEIKMSVIDEALKKNPRNLSLALLRLEIGEMLWERERVEKCWSDLVSRGRFEISFWRKYINFMKKKFESFTVSKMLETYKNCFYYMRAKLEDSFEVLGELMEFLWEVVEFLDGAGLTETCVAIFQLMFELNLNIPESIRYLPFSDKLDFLSAYWSGCQPKFGENKWMGWKEWVDVMGKSVTFVEPWTSKDVDEETEFKLIATHNSSRPKSWFHVETYRTGNHWCSWRPEKVDDDGEGCEDEDRIVMFDDISGFIFYANDDNFKFQIVWRFLDYLTKHSESFCFGNFSTSGIGHGSYTSFKEVFHSPAEFCVVDDNLVHSESMIANVYEVAISKFVGQHRQFLLHRFAEHILHSEKQHKEIRKIFKNILRDNNEDVSLWMKYARFERICGKMELANKVIDTTLASLTNTPLSSRKQSDDLLIRRCKIDFEIGFGCSMLCEGCSIFKKSNPKNTDRRFQDSDKILKLFDWLSDSKLEGPSGILKVKRILEKRVEDALNYFKSAQTSSDPLLNMSLHFFQHDILHLVHLQALFAFLSTNSIANVLAIYNAVLNRISSVSKSLSFEEKEVETLHRLLSRKRWKMLAFCEEFVFVPRSTYISVTTEDIKSHPTDVTVADNFYKINHTPSVQVVKDVMKLIYGDNDLICLKLQHIRSLIKKIVRFSETGFQVESTINELKSFFEICLSSQMASCSLTWSIYLYFHNLVKNEEKSSTRKFFRAIEGMPGSKMLYMQSILYNPDMLVKILRTMENKEVRLRTFIEEINLLTSSFKILNSMT